jgi:hypothetical protein
LYLVVRTIEKKTTYTLLIQHLDHIRFETDAAQQYTTTREILLDRLVFRTLHYDHLNGHVYLEKMVQEFFQLVPAFVTCYVVSEFRIATSVKHHTNLATDLDDHMKCLLKQGLYPASTSLSNVQLDAYDKFKYIALTTDPSCCQQAWPIRQPLCLASDLAITLSFSRLECVGGVLVSRGRPVNNKIQVLSFLSRHGAYLEFKGSFWQVFHGDIDALSPLVVRSIKKDQYDCIHLDFLCSVVMYAMLLFQQQTKDYVDTFPQQPRFKVSSGIYKKHAVHGIFRVKETVTFNTDVELEFECSGKYKKVSNNILRLYFGRVLRIHVQANASYKKLCVCLVFFSGVLQLCNSSLEVLETQFLHSLELFGNMNLSTGCRTECIIAHKLYIKKNGKFHLEMTDDSAGKYRKRKAENRLVPRGRRRKHEVVSEVTHDHLPDIDHLHAYQSSLEDVLVCYSLLDETVREGFKLHALQQANLRYDEVLPKLCTRTDKQNQRREHRARKDSQGVPDYVKKLQECKINVAKAEARESKLLNRVHVTKGKELWLTQIGRHAKYIDKRSMSLTFFHKCVMWAFSDERVPCNMPSFSEMDLRLSTICVQKWKKGTLASDMSFQYDDSMVVVADYQTGDYNLHMRAYYCMVTCGRSPSVLLPGMFSCGKVVLEHGFKWLSGFVTCRKKCTHEDTRFWLQIMFVGVCVLHSLKQCDIAVDGSLSNWCIVHYDTNLLFQIGTVSYKLVYPFVPVLRKFKNGYDGDGMKMFLKDMESKTRKDRKSKDFHALRKAIISAEDKLAELKKHVHSFESSDGDVVWRV